MKLAYVALVVLLTYGYGDATWISASAGMPHSLYRSVKSVKSVGASENLGIWITTDKNEVYLRKDEKGPWLRARTRANNLVLSYVSVAEKQAWGVNPQGHIYSTSFKSHMLPWRRIPGPPLKQVSVSDNNNVWGIHTDGTVWVRSRDGKWKRGAIPQMKMRSISVGWAGVWGVGVRGAIWYRPGSYGDLEPTGRWKLVKGALTQVHSGKGYVFGVNKNKDVYRREVREYNKAGSRWEKMGVKADMVTSGRDKLFGIQDGELVKKLNEIVN